MAVRLLVQFEDVRGIGTAIEQASSDMTTTMNELRTKADPSGIWEGASAEAYVQLMDQWKSSIESFGEAMNGLAQLLRSFADAMEQQDEDLASKILSGIG